MSEQELREYLDSCGVEYDEQPVPFGLEIRCKDGEIFCCYTSGKIVPQGKPTALWEVVKEWFETGVAPEGACPDLSHSAMDAASLYRRFFVLENTLRQLLERCLRAALGDRWLDDGVPKEIASHIRRLANHDDRDWRGGPEQPTLKFASFGQLADIIVADASRKPPILPFHARDHRETVVYAIRRLDPYRDDLGHMRAVSGKDKKRYLDLLDDLQNRLDRETQSI